MFRKHFEDLNVGDTVTTAVTVTEADIVNFANVSETTSMHTWTKRA